MSPNACQVWLENGPCGLPAVEMWCWLNTNGPDLPICAAHRDVEIERQLLRFK